MMPTPMRTKPRRVVRGAILVCRASKIEGSKASSVEEPPAIRQKPKTIIRKLTAMIM